MSRENVEVVRRLMDTMRGGASERIADFWEPDGDYYPVRKFPESRPCHGPEEVQRFMAEYEAAWGSYEFVVKDAHPVGDDRVFLHGYIRAEGRESGVALEGDLFQCFWLRHGRLFRQEDHLTRRGAMRALGLDEDHPDDSRGAAGSSE
jgi:hypothetical protein